MDYQDMTNAKLGEHFNQRAEKLGDETRVPNPWKGSKTAIIAKIKKLEDYNKSKPKPGTIRRLALDLLCEVTFFEDKTENPSPENEVKNSHPNARSVGIPYADIIDQIKVIHTDADTSVACLRWYAVKVRAQEFGYEGYNLVQRRPRSKNTD